MAVETIAKALGGRRVGRGWIARCPAHDDRKPSLSLRDAEGTVLVCCHAGCQQREVIAALKKRGLWVGSGDRRRVLRQAKTSMRLQRREMEPSAFGLSIWQTAVPAKDTLVETYLASRGLALPPTASVRFHSGLSHRPSGGIWPCMVALVTRGIDGVPLAINRTFLDRDGAGKAPVDPAKMMLGPCRGGAVRLAEAGPVLMVGEGIETCLAAMLATGHPAWAALSASGLAALEVPEHVREVIILADGDDAGEKAAQDCARRLRREGREVRIARPPRGLDFNDVLLGGASQDLGGAS